MQNPNSLHRTQFSNVFSLHAMLESIKFREIPGPCLFQNIGKANARLIVIRQSRTADLQKLHRVKMVDFKATLVTVFVALYFLRVARPRWRPTKTICFCKPFTCNRFSSTHASVWAVLSGLFGPTLPTDEVCPTGCEQMRAIDPKDWHAHG